MPGAGALAVLEASRVLDEVAIELPPVQTEVVQVFPAWTTVLEAPQAQQRRWQHQQQEERGPRHARPPALHLFQQSLGLTGCWQLKAPSDGSLCRLCAFPGPLAPPALSQKCRVSLAWYLP